MFGCNKITDESILNISTYCLQIEILNLARITNVTDNSIIQIINNCVNLFELNLARCRNVTGNFFEVFLLSYELYKK